MSHILAIQCVRCDARPFTTNLTVSISTMFHVMRLNQMRRITSFPIHHTFCLLIPLYGYLEQSLQLNIALHLQSIISMLSNSFKKNISRICLFVAEFSERRQPKWKKSMRQGMLRKTHTRKECLLKRIQLFLFGS